MMVQLAHFPIEHTFYPYDKYTVLRQLSLHLEKSVKVFRRLED